MLHATNHIRLANAGFRLRSVETPHGEMKVYDAKGMRGGPTVVLIHGVSGRASQYARVATSILPRCGRVVLPDLLGHGASTIPEHGLRVRTITQSLTTALDDIVPESMVLVGNSMGGLIAGLYVADRAWRVRGLMLTNPGGAPVDEATFYKAVGLLTPSNHTEALRLAHAGSSFRSRLILHLGARNVLRQLGRPHIRNFLLTATPDESLTVEQLQRFDMPVLLLTGNDDGVIPDETLDWYREHLPAHAVIKELDLFGHAPMAERPSIYTAHLRQFLAELDHSVEHMAAR